MDGTGRDGGKLDSNSVKGGAVSDADADLVNRPLWSGKQIDDSLTCEASVIIRAGMKPDLERELAIYASAWFQDPFQF